MNCFVSYAEMLRGTDHYLSWPTQEMKSHSLSSHYVAGIVGSIGPEKRDGSQAPAAHTCPFSQETQPFMFCIATPRTVWGPQMEMCLSTVFGTSQLFYSLSPLLWHDFFQHHVDIVNQIFLCLQNDICLSVGAVLQVPECIFCVFPTFSELQGPALSLSWRVGYRVGMSYTMQPTHQSSVLSVGCLNVRESNLDIGLGQQETIKSYWVTDFHVRPNKWILVAWEKGRMGKAWLRKVLTTSKWALEGRRDLCIASFSLLQLDIVRKKSILY